MKKIILTLFIALCYFTHFGQNISTGIDALGKATALGTTDLWKITSPAGKTAKSVDAYLPYWNPTPIAGTNAQWISGSANARAQTPGDYVFERTFTVATGISQLDYDLQLAYDDDLKNLSIIDPSGNATDLTSKVVRSTMPTAYFLNNHIKGSIKCPLKGTWRIVVIVNFYDSTAAFLLSGKIDQKQGNCCEIPDEKCSPNFKIKLSLNDQCNIAIDAKPEVTKGAQHYWGIVEIKNNEDCKPIPLGNIIAGNTFGLHISETGEVKPIGYGTGINAGETGFGYQYGGLFGPKSGKCYKITHYIKCCNKWYRKTVCFCPSLCTNEKEGEILEVPDKEVPKNLNQNPN
jgi:hypothetical protein